MPPFLHRVGFSFALGGAGYAIHSGDVRNGSGIATGMFHIYRSDTALIKRSLVTHVSILAFTELTEVTSDPVGTRDGGRSCCLCGELRHGVFHLSSITDIT